VVAGGAGVVPLPLSVLPLVAAVAAPVVARLVFLLRTPVLLVGALVARLVFLNKISIKINEIKKQCFRSMLIANPWIRLLMTKN
jgi:hypothetical protein